MHKQDPYGFGDVLSMESFDSGSLSGATSEEANSIQELIASANTLRDIGANIVESNGVSQQDALAMESIYPGILPARAPVGSFTKQPTQTNFAVALEALGAWSNFNIANLLKAVYRFLANIIAWIVNQVKNLFGNTKDGARVAKNITATVTAADTIVSSTSTYVPVDTSKAYEKALEKAKLQVSDGFNHLLKRLVTEDGAITAINTIRSQLHTAYAKLDTLTNKYAHALEICGKGQIHYAEANGLFSDLGSLNVDTLIDLSVAVGFFDQTRQLGTLSGVKQVAALRDHCLKLSKKQSSWDVKTTDTLSAFSILATRLSDLFEVLDDPIIGDEVPTVKDFSGRAKDAPSDLTPALETAGTKITEAFEVTRDTVAIFVLIAREVLNITQITWDASKKVMGEIATKAKQTSEVKDMVTNIETNLKSALKKA